MQKFSTVRSTQAFISYLLCLSLVVSGSPFLVQKAFSTSSVNPSGGTESLEVNPEIEKQTRIQGLIQTIMNPAGGQAELDTFEMLRQRVLDDRTEPLEAIESKRKLEDFLGRQEDLKSRIETLNELNNKVQSRLASVSPGTEAHSEITLVQEDIRSRRELARMELQDLEQFDPRKEGASSLEIDFMIDKSLKTRHYWGRNMTLRIESLESGQPALEISQKDFSQSLSPRFNKANPLESLDSGILNQDLGFSLVDPKGVVLNQFQIPVEAIFFFGHYLVFVEKSSSQGAQDYNRGQIRFIDLEYFKPNIGNAPLPVYTLPLSGVQVGDTYSIENGQFKVGSHKMSYQQFAMLAQTQQLIFNVNVALVDPKTYDSVKPLIEEIHEFFKKSMSQQDQLFQTGLEKAASTTDFIEKESSKLQEKPKITAEVEQEIKGFLADGSLSKEELEVVKKHLKIDEDLSTANRALRDGHALTTRLKLLMHYLIQPRPQGAPLLFDSLIMVAMGNKEQRARSLDWIQKSWTYKAVKYGAATGGVLLAGTMLPEPYSLNLYQGLDLVASVHDHFQGYLKHIDYGRAYAVLAKDAFVTSFTGWTYFFNVYFADGVWSKFLYGVFTVLLVVIKVFLPIHITVNSFKMLNQTLKIRRASDYDISFLEAFKKAADQDQKAYWQNLADEEKKVSGSDASMISPEEKILLQEHLERLKSGREDLKFVEKDVARLEAGKKLIRKDSVRKFLSTVTGFKKWFRFGSETQKLMDQTTQDLKLKNVETLRGALVAAYFSYPSLKTLFKVNTINWNYLFVTRSYVLSPSKWLMFLLYPNYFNVTLSTREGRQHFPSHYNRGLELWPQKLYRMASGAVHRTPFLKESNVAEKLFISRESLDNLKAFESYVVSMEAVAMELAKSQAQKALIENVQDPKRLMILFDSSLGHNEPSTGIRNLHDTNKLKELNQEEKVFYRAYFTRSFDLIMQGFISQMNAVSSVNSQDPEAFAKDFVKGIRNGTVTSVTFNKEKLETLEKEITRIIDFKAVGDWANQVAHKMSHFTDKVDIQYRHKLLETMYPKQTQIERFLASKDKVEKPRAMERAMRMGVSDLVVAIPVGLVTTLALYAGVETGILRPFDPEGMDTETHFKYMSRYLFYNGFIPGVIISLMANTWFKLQQDARIDDGGGFAKMIAHSDGKKGFWRYYLKNFFKNPQNKWIDNQTHMLRLVTANIPAFMVTFTVTSLYGLGRIDLGAFLATYIISYGTFLLGIGFKLDQAFELASSWVYNKIPRKLRADTDAQKYINGEIQKRKIAFAFVSEAWTLVADQVFENMLVLKDNVQYGTRAFLRLVFGGDTPTQIVVDFADKLIGALRAVPGMETSLEFTKTVFSRNYEAFERFPERLSMPDEGVQRVFEDPSLPKSAMGEFIGKTIAMVSTLGVFASLPYVGSEAMHRRKQSQLQKEGRQIMQEEQERQKQASLASGSVSRCDTLYKK
jgi:hypothetical protein